MDFVGRAAPPVAGSGGQAANATGSTARGASKGDAGTNGAGSSVPSWARKLGAASSGAVTSSGSNSSGQVSSIAIAMAGITASLIQQHAFAVAEGAAEDTSGTQSSRQQATASITTKAAQNQQHQRQLQQLNGNAVGGGEFTLLDLFIAGILISVILIAIVGNCLVCIAIFTDRRLRKLGNAFIVSLAIADLFLSCLVMTFALCNDLMNYWIFGDWFCDVWISFDIMCCTASILNLCAISLDRFIHIKDCFRYEQWMTRKVALSAVVIIWFISALVSFVPINLGWHKPDHFSGSISDSVLSSSVSTQTSSMAAVAAATKQIPLDNGDASRQHEEENNNNDNNNCDGASSKNDDWQQTAPTADSAGGQPAASLPPPQQPGRIARANIRLEPATSVEMASAAGELNYAPSAAQAQADGQRASRFGAGNEARSAPKGTVVAKQLEAIENQSSPEQQRQQHQQQQQQQKRKQGPQEEELARRPAATTTEVAATLGSSDTSKRNQPLPMVNSSGRDAKRQVYFVSSSPVLLSPLSLLLEAQANYAQAATETAETSAGSSSGEGASSSTKRTRLASATLTTRQREQQPPPHRRLPFSASSSESAQFNQVEFNPQDGSQIKLAAADLLEPAAATTPTPTTTTTSSSSSSSSSSGSPASGTTTRASVPRRAWRLKRHFSMVVSETDAAPALDEPESNSSIGGSDSGNHHCSDHSGIPIVAATTTAYSGAGNLSSGGQDFSGGSEILSAYPMQQLPVCMLTLTPTYAVISSTISFYIPCVIMLGLYIKLFACARRHVRSIQAIKVPAPIGPSRQSPPAADNTNNQPLLPLQGQQQPIGPRAATSSRPPLKTWLKLGRSQAFSSTRHKRNQNAQSNDKSPQRQLGGAANSLLRAADTTDTQEPMPVLGFKANEAHEEEEEEEEREREEAATSSDKAPTAKVAGGALQRKALGTGKLISNQRAKSRASGRSSNILTDENLLTQQLTLDQIEPAPSGSEPFGTVGNGGDNEMTNGGIVSELTSASCLQTAQSMPAGSQSATINAAEQEPFLAEQGDLNTSKLSSISRQPTCSSLRSSSVAKTNTYTNTNANTTSTSTATTGTRAAATTQYQYNNNNNSVVAVAFNQYRPQRHLQYTTSNSSADNNGQQQPQLTQCQRQQRQQQQQQSAKLATHKAAVTLGIIMGTFLFCWVPFFCLNIIKAFCVDCIPSSVFRFFTWLGYANSALNPIIYGIHNTEFRCAFNRIFKHLNIKNSRYLTNRRMSYDLRRHQNSASSTATVNQSSKSCGGRIIGNRKGKRHSAATANANVAYEGGKQLSPKFSGATTVT